MLQYLIIPLCDTAVSYCHYENRKRAPRLLPLDALKRAVLFAMKENLMVQFVHPDYALPEEYLAAIDEIDHTDIVPARSALRDAADVVVFDGFDDLRGFAFKKETAYVLRTPHCAFFDRFGELSGALAQVSRLNVVFTDVETFTEKDFSKYKEVLAALSATVEGLFAQGGTVQLNLLTDRMMLEKMNNCGAGETNLTLAPDGRFYVCPAFYFEEDGPAVGSLDAGLDVKNAQLYRLDHAPLCRHCDAYHCKRCVWLNRKTTLEVNTPSHEQCVTAHLERNAARKLLTDIRRHGTFLPEMEEIKQIDYLDPFDVRKEW